MQPKLKIPTKTLMLSDQGGLQINWAVCFSKERRLEIKMQHKMCSIFNKKKGGD